jgi:acyl-coenzyme A synthetase/AMP-(fatty) acid ligase/aryl carrier-like protein
LRGVKQLLAGGDVLSPTIIARVLEGLPQCNLINGYGPTECTTFAACYQFPHDFSARSAPIGRPITNTQIYILDESLNPVPIGVPGEIYIAGAGVARGYLGRPELTAEKFIPNPFGEAGSRMYKSGDLGRYRPDGNIEFLGRIDHQVKVRGFRIELGEIENALLGCEGVREAVVVAREDDPGDKRLIAYVVAQDVKPTTDALRSQLQQFLPEYMLPAAWMFLDALPLNASGKIDRNALPEPDVTGDLASPLSEDTGAISDTVGKILEMMQSIVPSEFIRDDSNFVNVGFHSINLMRLVAKCRTGFGVPLTITEAAKASCARRLAGIVESRQIDRSSFRLDE